MRTTAAATNAVFFTVVALAPISSVRSRQRPALGAASVGAALLLAFVPSARSELDPTILQDTESMYGRVRVVAEQDEHGRKFIAYRSTLSYWHTVTYPDEPAALAAGLVLSRTGAGRKREEQADSGLKSPWAQLAASYVRFYEAGCAFAQIADAERSEHGAHFLVHSSACSTRANVSTIRSAACACHPQTMPG